MIPFVKYHGLGNDYLVLMNNQLSFSLSPELVQRICHRNYGIGSDGILLMGEKGDGVFNLTIFNPDGSVGETSGNGLRIFSRFLYDQGYVAHEPFKISVAKRQMIAEVSPETLDVRVEMGRATFDSREIPVIGPQREVLREEIELAGETLTYGCCSVGNPHCVVLGRKDLKEDALKFGPLLETHERFPNRTNVQFARVISRKKIQIEIWERGAGYTLASGSSSSATAALCHRLGLCDNSVTVSMPGGTLSVAIDSNYGITLVGPVVRVSTGQIELEALGQLLQGGVVN